MAKYNYEFKKKIVQEYLNGVGGYAYLSKKFGVPAKRNIEAWVHAYKEFGDNGLMRSRKNTAYSFEFKLHVVELYLTKELSYQDLALAVGMNNPTLISKWVNDYQIAGPDALIPKRKGRGRKMNKSSDIIADKMSPSNANKEYLKQLEEENLRLRIENAYLKELRRLRLEDEARLREQQESSTASEENSN